MGRRLPPRAMRRGEDVGRRDRILDGEVDPDPADRRHRMGGVANRQQARAVPTRQPVERYCEEVEIGDRSKAAFARKIEVGEGLGDLSCDPVDAARLDRVAAALGDQEGALPISRGGRSARPSARFRSTRAAPRRARRPAAGGTRTRPSARRALRPAAGQACGPATRARRRRSPICPRGARRHRQGARRRCGRLPR